MSFINWLENKNERLVIEKSDYSDCKIEFGGLVKDEEVTKTFFINEHTKDGYILRNTKTVTPKTKYWVFSDGNRKIVTQKTGRLVLEDVFRTVIDKKDVEKKLN